MSLTEMEDQISKLEQEELEGLHDETDFPFYSSLFVAYLFKNDLVSARYLWKRLPNNLKSCTEFEKLFEIYLSLSNNNNAEFFQVAKFHWSELIAPTMKALYEKIQNEVINLIGKAYTSIFENIFIEKTNIPSEEINKICNSLGWTVEEFNNNRLIIPKHKVEERPIATNSEDQLLILTNFVSFLEN